VTELRRREFHYRGVVEGFYGTPWTHVDRLWMLERMAAWGMNTYVYAPKEDPLHRDRWREPYPQPQVAEFCELVRSGEREGVRFGFALSPGVSIVYSDPSDWDALVAKLRACLEWGVRLLVLAVDDVPAHLVHAADRERYGSLAEAHVHLVQRLCEALGDAVALWLVPTEYLGVSSSPYLETLGRGLPARVEIGWTGRTVMSPSVASDEARARAASLRRSPWLWDNVPVADGPMRHLLHMAPYLGREPSLPETLSGVLLNPMQHARSSAVTLATAGAFLRDPEGYDPEEAWERAVAELGAGAPEHARVFARAHRFAPQSVEDRDVGLEEAFLQLQGALQVGADLGPPHRELLLQVEARLPAAAALREGATDRRWVAELEPWLESHACETQRMHIALEALGILIDPDASAADRTLAYVRMEARLTRLPAARAVSFGPRRVLYPQLSSMRDEDMGFGPEPCLITGRCLADEMVDLVADLAVWLQTDPDPAVAIPPPRSPVG